MDEGYSLDDSVYDFIVKAFQFTKDKDRSVIDGLRGSRIVTFRMCMKSNLHDDISHSFYAYALENDCVCKFLVGVACAIMCRLTIEAERMNSNEVERVAANKTFFVSATDKE